ncbi:MAG: ferrous iron transporter B [Candidatus Planktophila sp.]|nr:ferrous iron transporter B [Candidatus Planktophila sp.]
MCSECKNVVHGSVLEDRKNPVVAVVGRSNVGKSTLFTRISGVHRKMGNWPATTVEVGSAEVSINGDDLTLLDLPGIASIHPVSPDEVLAVDILKNGKPDLVLFIIDCASMARCLFLLSELIEQGEKVLVALSMNDVAQRRGIDVSTQKLSAELGLPVVKVNPRKNEGIEELKSAITANLGLSQNPVLISFNSIEERVDWVHSITQAVTTKHVAKKSLSDKFDRIFISPILGPLALLTILWLVFQGTTTFAAPMQDWLDIAINQKFGSFVSAQLGSNAIINGLVVNGILAGVGLLLTFLPVMSVMFFFLSFLEDSGYMARAAVVADRIMRFAGLPGRAILPMLVGFGCNVPAVSATRALSDARHRLIAGLAVPFTACSARLAVYVFVGTIFFSNKAGSVIFAMYLISISLVIGFSFIFKSLFATDAPREPLLIELPPYKLPTSMLIVSDAWLRVKGFLREAGGIVIITVIAVWALMAIPFSSGYSFGEVPVERSAYGSLSKAISPIFAPAGFGDWHTTGALVTGFVAKEVVISSWAQNYAVDAGSDETQRESLGKLLMRDFEKSSGGATFPAIWAFLVFLTAYTPCVATIGAQKKEFGTKWALIGVGLQLAIAWILAVAIFQIGRFFV